MTISPAKVYILCVCILERVHVLGFAVVGGTGTAIYAFQREIRRLLMCRETGEHRT